MSFSPPAVSAQCRQGRHASCPPRLEATCGCDCHDKAVPLAPPFDPATVRAAVDEMRAEPASTFERFPCPHLSCDHRPFSTEQGLRVHIARMHPSRGETVVADEPEARDVGELATAVAEALAFLDGREWDEIVNEALDEWAARTLTHDAEVKALVEIRRKRTERSGR